VKRRIVHGIFAGIALCLLAVALLQWRLLEQARTIGDAIGRVQLAPPSAEPAPPDFPELSYPEVKLAWANALAADGQFDAAEFAFNELIQQKQNLEVSRAAQFNLANAYVRQGMRADLTAEQKHSLLELAKQRYRDLLRATPDDWDLRYNLQSALRLAPEDAEALADDKGEPIKRVNVIVPGFEIGDLP